MNPPVSTDAEEATITSVPAATPREVVRGRRRLNLGLDRFSGLYVWALLIVVFGLWMPSLFLTADNARIIAGDEAITAILAFGLIIPLAAGVFDLSIAGTMGFSSVIVIWYQSHGHNPVVGAILAVLVGSVIGLINGFVVVKLHVDSFIATLGMSSVLAAEAYWATNGQQIVTGISPTFLNLRIAQLFGVPDPVYYIISLGLVLSSFLEYRPSGRYLHVLRVNPNEA